jgi:hypothetical protein
MAGPGRAARLAKILRDLHDRVSALEILVPEAAPHHYDSSELADLLAVPPPIPAR